MKFAELWARLNRERLARYLGPLNPFEAYQLVACIVQGIGVVSGYAKPPSIEILLPNLLRFVWGTLLLLGGVAVVVGLYWRWDPIDGVLIRRIGLIAAGGGTGIYGIALLALGPEGFVAGVFNIAFALACFARVHQIGVAIRQYQRDLQAISHASPP